MISPAVSSQSSFTPKPPRDGGGFVASGKTERGSRLAKELSSRIDDAQLSSAEQAQLRKLKAADTQVRAHEQAHAAAAGSVSHGAPKYTLVRGPDGNSYAVAGEVAIDTSPVAGDPKATAAKAETIRRAALAPAQPSGQDMAIAAAASSMLMQARLEMQREEAQASSAEQGDSAEVVGAVESSKNSSQSVRSVQEQSGTDKSAGACSVCGGQHGSGAHSDAVSVILQNTYQATF